MAIVGNALSPETWNWTPPIANPGSNDRQRRKDLSTTIRRIVTPARVLIVAIATLLIYIALFHLARA
jgi:hypothetical protein